MQRRVDLGKAGGNHWDRWIIRWHSQDVQSTRAPTSLDGGDDLLQRGGAILVHRRPYAKRLGEYGQAANSPLVKDRTDVRALILPQIKALVHDKRVTMKRLRQACEAAWKRELFLNWKQLLRVRVTGSSGNKKPCCQAMPRKRAMLPTRI